MNCPICGAPAKDEGTGNGGELYVAEEFDECTECFDSSVILYRCTANNTHAFYVGGYDE